MEKTGNNLIDGDDGRDCRSPKHMGCEQCENTEENNGIRTITGVLEELEGFVQEMREEGETDLRTILHAIKTLKNNPNTKLKEE